MLTQIDVQSEDAFQLPILGVTPKSSLLIKKVTGLNPPDKSLFIGEYSQDGGIYQGRRVGNRNVVITMDLNPNPALGETVASLRQMLYKAFNDPQVDGDYLKIRLYEENNRVTYLVGYCEKFETDLFDVDTMCQISLICPDPYLRSDTDVILQQPTGWVQVPFNYEGSAETGFNARIYVTTPTNAITLSNNGKLMQLQSNAGYYIDDLIIVNTVRGYRSITLTKPGDITSTPTEFIIPQSYAVGSLVYYGGAIWQAVSTILGNGVDISMAPGNNNDFWTMVSKPIVAHLTPRSQWLELHAADNVMRVYEGDEVTSIVAKIKYLRYTPAYWGI